MGLELVPNKEGYYEFIRNLRNDDRVRDGFIQQEHISLEEQVAYMQVHESDYFICLNDETPVGYIGVIDGDIRLCTSPDHQRPGHWDFYVNRDSENISLRYWEHKERKCSKHTGFS